MGISRRTILSGLISTPLISAGMTTFAGSGRARDDGTVLIGGTGSALGGMKLVAAAYMALHPTRTVEVLPSLGSGGGIAALLADAIDIAVAARAPKASEEADGAIGEIYGISPVIFVSQHNTDCSTLTLAQVEAIYRGTMTRWCDGHPIRPVLRQPSESDVKLLTTLTPGMREALATARQRPGQITALNDQENADALVSLEGSFGMIVLAQMLSERRALQTIQVGSFEPTPANALSGAYPIVKHHHFVTRAGTSKAALAFLDFARSPTGRAVLRQHGHFAPGGTA